MSPDGFLIDVTPYPEQHHAPSTPNSGFTPVIVDPDAVPEGGVSLPLRFFVLDAEDARLRDYVDKLSSEEHARYRAELNLSANSG